MTDKIVDFGFEDVSEIEEWKIDRMIEEIKENNTELERLKEIRDKRIEEINERYRLQEEKILKKNHYILSTLKQYAFMRKDILKETKTQFKLPMLSGNVIIKKPIPKVAKPSSDQIEKIERLFPEYVEKVEEKKVNWKELKKQLIIDGNRIIDANTGEDVTDIFEIEEGKEEVIVK